MATSDTSDLPSDDDTSLVDARRERLQRSQEESFPYFVRICGRDFVVHEGVFSPKYFDSTAAFSEIFPYRQGDDLLEMGSGVGATAVLAALNGARRVVAVDISPAAVQNTRANAELHGVASLVESRESDLFSAIQQHERFRTIYWNIPLIYIEPSYRHASELERSVYDPGYELADRFLREAPAVLAPRGRVLVGYASVGRTEAFLELARTHGYTIDVSGRRFAARDPNVEFTLYELVPIAPSH